MYEDLTFCFDIDGTLCPIKKKEEAYIDLVPYPEMIDKIREYKAGGAKIVLFTSRKLSWQHRTDQCQYRKGASGMAGKMGYSIR
mgnify:CR=1 FL=1